MGWELGFGLGAAALLLTLIYGVIHSRQASDAANRAGEAGAKRLYDQAGESEASPDTRRRKKAPPLVWIMVAILAIWLATIFALRDGIQDHGDMGAASPAAAPSKS